VAADPDPAPASPPISGPPGGSASTCKFMGCFGDDMDGRQCSGNANDCTSRGFSVKGYLVEDTNHTCGGGHAVCESGVLVICEKCEGPTSEPPATPTPPTAPPPPVYPTTTSTSTGTTPTTQTPATLAPMGGPASQEALNLTETEDALKEALKQVETARKTVRNATKIGQSLADNLTQAEADFQEYSVRAEDDRHAAVTFAKQKALANQTVRRAQLALDDAVTGETAATKQAVVDATIAKNADQNRTYYKKMLIDQKKAEDASLHDLELAKVAVKRANANLHVARAQTGDKAILDNRRATIDQIDAHQENVRARVAEVKDDMESAFMSSSLDRDANNTPSWGRHWINGLNR